MIKKKKKIILPALLLAGSALQAAPYVGIQASSVHHKANGKFQGKDWVNNSTLVTISKGFSLNQSAIGIGGIVGYEKKITSVFSGFIETGYTYFNSHKAKSNIDLYQDEFNIANVLDKEKVSVRMRQQISVMPGINIAITENLAGVMACGLTLTQYSVNAGHNSGKRVRPDNTKSKKAFIFGVEPTLGFKYKFNNALSTRLTVGYNIGQSKRIIDNYIEETVLANAGVTNSVWMKPRSLNIRATAIFEF